MLNLQFSTRLKTQNFVICLGNRWSNVPFQTIRRPSSLIGIVPFVIEVNLLRLVPSGNDWINDTIFRTSKREDKFSMIKLSRVLFVVTARESR
jgi:hypothetical protein